MFKKLLEKATGGAKKITGKTDLLEGIAAMAALVSAADGDIEDSEVGAVIEALSTHQIISTAFSQVQIEAVVDKQLRRAKGGFSGKLALKREIAEMKNKNASDELEMAFMVALDVSMSDGEMEPAEKKVLEELGRSLGLNLSNYI